MIHTSYTDENGNEVLFASSMFTLTREGLSEPTPLSKEEYKQKIKAIEEKNKDYKERNLAQELDDLKAENELLKGKLDEVKTNVDKLKKP